MKIRRAGVAILAITLCLPSLFAQSATKANPIEALAGKWDVHCIQKGCLMFTDVLIGDPDHPADLKHPQYITIAVAINRSDRKPAYIDFDLPPDADRSQGFFVAFAKTSKDGKNWKLTLVKSATAHLVFMSCNEDSCKGRAVKGVIPSDGEPPVDLLREFLQNDQILFLFTRNGEPYRTMRALFPFQRAYQHLMKTELKQSSK